MSPDRSEQQSKELLEAKSEQRLSTTDFEALFLRALANGMRAEPIATMERILGEGQSMLTKVEIGEPLRFNSCYTDGETLWAYRWASGDRAPSLFTGPRKAACSSCPNRLTRARATGPSRPSNRSCGSTATACESKRCKPLAAFPQDRRRARRGQMFTGTEAR